MLFIVLATIAALFAVILLWRFVSPNYRQIIPPTWKTNWRETLALVILGGGSLLINAHLDWIGGWFGEPSKFAYLSSFLLGFAAWSGANFCGTLGVILWPTINKFGNEDFANGWRELSVQWKTLAYVGFVLVQMVIGAICFGGAFA